MNNVYLHSKNTNDSLLRTTLILFIPFILYGLYKNIVVLILHDYDMLSCIKPLIFLGISIIISLIIKLIYKEKFISNNLIENLIISMIVLPNTNIFVYLVLIVALNFLREYLRFNKALVFIIINIIIMMILNKYTFMNLYEIDVAHNYSVFDLIMGKGYGGMFNTLIAMTGISLCILCGNIIYKKGSSISAIVTYYILIIIYSFATKTLNIDLLVNNNILFAYVFIVPISIYSPYSRGASYIYGVLIGILTFISVFFDVNLGVYVSILILNLLSYVLDSLIIGKDNKKRIKKS